MWNGGLLISRFLTLLVAGVAVWSAGPSSALAQDSSKILVATFLFKKNTIEPVEAIIAFGSAKMPKTPPKEVRDFLISLHDEKGHKLGSYGIQDPRNQYLDEGKAFESETAILVVVPEASYTARLPFDPKVREIRVLKDMTIITSANLKPIIQKFCAKHEKDKDCRFIANQSP